MPSQASTRTTENAILAESFGANFAIPTALRRSKILPLPEVSSLIINNTEATETFSCQQQQQRRRRETPNENVKFVVKEKQLAGAEEKIEREMIRETNYKRVYSNFFFLLLRVSTCVCTICMYVCVSVCNHMGKLVHERVNRRDVRGVCFDRVSPSMAIGIYALFRWFNWLTLLFV